MEIFQFAAKNKLRFDTNIGILSAEDIWDLPLTGGRLSLDTLARGLNRKLKESEEESFVSQKSTTDRETEVQFEITKLVIATKLADKDKAQKAADTRARKQQILGLISEKQNEELKGKSADDLQKLLDEL